MSLFKSIFFLFFISSLLPSCKVYKTVEYKNIVVNHRVIDKLLKHKRILTIENSIENRYLIKNPIITQDSIKGILIKAEMSDHPTYPYKKFKENSYSNVHKFLHLYTDDTLVSGYFHISRKLITKIDIHKSTIGFPTKEKKSKK